MIKSILKPVFNMLSPRIQNEIKHYRNQLGRNQIIKNWEEKGRPIPPPHQYKQVTISGYQKEFGYNILIETGTFFGEMIDAQRKNFKQIYSVELDSTFHSNARKKFAPYKHITLIQGDSGKELFKLVPGLKGPAIFWLDGHFSGGNTAMGDTFCPVMNELTAIFNSNLHKNIILIDDARDFTGVDGYPSIEELKLFISEQSKGYDFSIKDDIIRIIPHRN